MRGLLSDLKLDYKDLLLVESLGEYGPRNILRIAKKLGMPESSIRYRIKRLKEKGLLYMHANVYHTNIGLKKGVVFVDANPRYRQHIHRFIDANDYWIQMDYIHGRKEGVYVLFTVPDENFDKLRSFLNELVKTEVILDYELFESTCYHRVNPRTNWYDVENKKWRFEWSRLISDVENESTELPVTLRDPKGFPILADETDVFILKELEKDPTISFRELGMKIGTTPQNIKYHYDHHIIGNFLLEDYTIFIARYDPKTSVILHFILDFPNSKMLAKTANAFMKRPFSEIMGKILRQNKLILFSYIPITEYANMLETMNYMAEMGYITRYKYYIALPTEKGHRETIPYKLFRDKHWLYKHEEYIDRIYEVFRNIENVHRSVASTEQN